MEIRDDIKFYAKAAQQGRGYIAGQIELTSDCFQQCFMCDSWKAHRAGRERGDFTLKELLEICEDLAAMPTFEHLSFTGGDPQSWKPFDEFLRVHRRSYPFTIQIATALMKDPDVELWRQTAERVRISLDGIRPETYKRIRGVDIDPQVVLDRIEALDHPGLATITTVTDYNIDEVPEIIERVNSMKTRPRKMMFLAVLQTKLKDGYWEKYRALRDIPSAIPTSFGEDVMWVRDTANQEFIKDWDCAVQKISFHIKANGDVYPCCLIGGEAIAPVKEMVIGNVHERNLWEIQMQARTMECKHYAKPDSPCIQVCQFKQLQMNMAAHEASKLKLQMP